MHRVQPLRRRMTRSHRLPREYTQGGIFFSGSDYERGSGERGPIHAQPLVGFAAARYCGRTRLGDVWCRRRHHHRAGAGVLVSHRSADRIRHLTFGDCADRAGRGDCLWDARQRQYFVGRVDGDWLGGGCAGGGVAAAAVAEARAAIEFYGVFGCDHRVAVFGVAEPRVGDLRQCGAGGAAAGDWFRGGCCLGPVRHWRWCCGGAAACARVWGE